MAAKRTSTKKATVKKAAPKSKAKRKAPVKYSPAVVARLLAKIANGGTRASLAKDRTMPDSGTIIDWRRAHPEFDQQYLVVMTSRGEYHADQVAELSDSLDGCDDHVEVQAIGKRIDANKWLASKFYPKMFGDRQHIDLDANVSTGPQEWDLSKLSKAETAAFMKLLAKCTPVNGEDCRQGA